MNHFLNQGVRLTTGYFDSWNPFWVYFEGLPSFIRILTARESKGLIHSPLSILRSARDPWLVSAITAKQLRVWLWKRSWMKLDVLSFMGTFESFNLNKNWKRYNHWKTSSISMVKDFGWWGSPPSSFKGQGCPRAQARDGIQLSITWSFPAGPIQKVVGLFDFGVLTYRRFRAHFSILSLSILR